jgi:hypothetical protein
VERNVFGGLLMKTERFRELFSNYTQEYCDNTDDWLFLPYSNMLDYITLKMLYEMVNDNETH